jgi:hypothetical protein
VGLGFRTLNSSEQLLSKEFERFERAFARRARLTTHDVMLLGLSIAIVCGQ